MNELTINHKPSTITLKERSYIFSLQIIDFVRNLPEDKILLTIGDQLLRSSTSVGSNIVEAKASKSEKEFVKYSEIAVKSANKAQYWLSLIRDTYKEMESDSTKLISDLKEISSSIESELLKVKGRRGD